MMAPRRPRPPLVARLVLAALLGPDDRATVDEDLGELFDRRVARDGEREAARWLRRQWRQHASRLVIERARQWAWRRPAPRFGAGQYVRAVVSDLRHSGRSALRSPGLTLTIVATVGLGIGATTSIYAVVDHVLLRPLPYPDADRLVRVYTDAPPNRWPFSVVDYHALVAQQTRFSQVAGFQTRAMTFNRDDVAVRVVGQVVTPSYFSLLGLTPARGRLFIDADGQSDAERAVVVSHRFWTQYLGADDQVIGTPVRFDRNDYTLVGVLSPNLSPLQEDRDFFMATEWDPPTRKGPFFITALARLAPGVTIQSATDEMRAINSGLFPLWRSSYQDDQASWGVMGLKDVVVGDVGPTIAIVFGAVGFLLLTACANAANLLVARAGQRRRELAVRTALGASRGRLMQHLLSEAALLAAGSAAVGFGIAVVGLRLLTSAGADYLPRAAEVGLSGRVLLFHAALTLGGVLLIGLVPALHGIRAGAQRVVHMHGLRTTTGSGAARLRAGLVVAQFALAVPLLIGAGLLVGSLSKLHRVDPGFDSTGLLTAGVLLPETAYGDEAAIMPFWDVTLERLRALPGVRVVALADARPPNEVPNVNNFDLEDKPTPPGASQPAVPWLAVSPAYFELMGVPVVEGRGFDDRDRSADEEVVVVDQAWARRFFPEGRVVGRRLVSGGCTSCPPTTVVGVVGDIRYTGLDHPGEGTVYYPGPGNGPRFAYIYLRTDGDPMSIVPMVRDVVRSVDPALPIQDVATVDQLMAESLAPSRALALVVAAFAGVALMLAVLGVYGVMSYFVQQHAKDISIRMALGGAPAAVAGLVVGRGAWLVGVGVGVGLMGAFGLTRFLSSVLFEVTATDGATFLLGALAMAGVALAACLVPAWRAAGIDPLRALRDE